MSSKTYRSKKGPSQRQLRAGELVRHALVGILAREDLRDPDLDGVSVTISEVRPSPDLRSATVFCAPLGAAPGTKASETVVAALNRCAPFLRGRLGREIEMKFTPALRFEADRSFDTANAVDALLSDPRVAQDLSGSED